MFHFPNVGTWTYVIEIKEKHGQKPHRHRYEHPFDWQIPEVNNPRARYGRVESTCVRQSLDVR